MWLYLLFWDQMKPVWPRAKYHLITYFIQIRRLHIVSFIHWCNLLIPDLKCSPKVTSNLKLKNSSKDCTSVHSLLETDPQTKMQNANQKLHPFSKGWLGKNFNTFCDKLKFWKFLSPKKIFSQKGIFS